MAVTTSTSSSFLPLTPLVFHVLLALADKPRHGYGVIQDVTELTAGGVTLRTGTLYTQLSRLLADGLIAESDARPVRGDDERRRYYQLTPLGRDVIKAEARRLESLVGEARRKRVLGPRAKA